MSIPAVRSQIPNFFNALLACAPCDSSTSGSAHPRSPMPGRRSVHTISGPYYSQGVFIMKRVLALMGLLLAGAGIRADEPKRLMNVAYGKHPRQVLDFYQAKSEKPAPVVFYIHGGGWQAGDKKFDPQPYLAKG